MSNPGNRTQHGTPRGASFFAAMMPVGVGSQFEDVWLISTLTEALARRGVTVVAGGQATLFTEEGMELGLDNLTRQLRLAPRSEWKRIVDHHAADVAASRQEAMEEHHLSDPDTVIYARVIPGASLGSPAGPIPAYAEALGADLWAIAVLRRPGRTLMLMADDALDEAGGWEAVRPRALGAIRSLGLPELSLITREDRPEMSVFVLEAEDTFGSARLLLLDELLMHITDGHQVPWGCLVAVPHRHMMLVHIVVGEGIGEVIDVMSRVASQEYARQMGPCSPLVYYRPSTGLLEPVTSGVAGPPRLAVGPSFGAVLAELDVTLAAS